MFGRCCLPAQNWYDNYYVWSQAAHAGELVNGLAPDAPTFNAWVSEFLDGPGVLFANNVKFSRDGSRIIGSKIDMYSRNFVDGAWAIRLVDSVRADAKAAAPSLQPIVFNLNFLFYDGFKVRAAPMHSADVPDCHAITGSASVSALASS